MVIILILILSFTINIECKTQNNVTDEGLRIGNWVEFSNNIKYSGNYVISHLDTYKIIRPSNFKDKTYEVKYYHSLVDLEYESRHDNNISVKDSIWKIIDSNGVTRCLEYWESGIKIAYRFFDAFGNIEEYEYLDVTKDSVFNFYYIDNELFKQKIRLNNKYEEQIKYYPLKNIIIKDAEPTYTKIFNDTTNIFYFINIKSKSKTKLQYIRSSTQNIKIDSNIYKKYLNENDSLFVKVTFDPKPIYYQNYDTIYIKTMDDESEYKIFCRLEASHLIYKNLKDQEVVDISRSKDRFLVVSQMGSVTDAYILDSNQNKNIYRINQTTKIDLLNYPIGEYKLIISSCNIGGTIKLNILK